MHLRLHLLQGFLRLENQASNAIDPFHKSIDSRTTNIVFLKFFIDVENNLALKKKG